jgi:hypothetical protein
MARDSFQIARRKPIVQLFQAGRNYLIQHFPHP